MQYYHTTAAPQPPGSTQTQAQQFVNYPSSQFPQSRSQNPLSGPQSSLSQTSNTLQQPYPTQPAALYAQSVISANSSNTAPSTTTAVPATTTTTSGMLSPAAINPTPAPADHADPHPLHLQTSPSASSATNASGSVLLQSNIPSTANPVATAALSTVSVGSVPGTNSASSGANLVPVSHMMNPALLGTQQQHLLLQQQHLHLQQHLHIHPNTQGGFFPQQSTSAASIPGTTPTSLGTAPTPLSQQHLPPFPSPATIPVTQQQHFSTLVNTCRQEFNHLPSLQQTASSPINILSASAQSKIAIREVWAHNLHQEIKTIVELVQTYNYIAMDTEFPGVVVRPTTYRNNNEYQYQLIKHNADILKLIQLGICLCDEHGNVLPDYCCWQFNFQFDITQDQFAQDSLDLLQKSGIDFSRLSQYGIPWQSFGEVLLSSGLLLNDTVHWLSFHSSYDFAYLARIFTNAPLPPSYTSFASLLRLYCPCIYDIKYIMRCCDNLTGGLEKIAHTLRLHRNGQQHQAGSDAMLTAAVFFKVRNVYFDGELDNDKYAGIIYGLTSLVNSYSTPIWQ